MDAHRPDTDRLVPRPADAGTGPTTVPEESPGAILGALCHALVAVIDREGQFLRAWIAPELVERHGISVEMAEGRLASELMPPANAAKLARHLARVFETGRSSRHVQLRAEGAHAYWYDISLSPIFGAHDRIRTVAVFVRDITDLKQANLELHRAQAELAEAEQRERRRIAADLHDAVGHPLALAKLEVELARTSVPDETGKEAVAKAAALLEEAGRAMAAAVFDLAPPVLEAGGLAAALEQLVHGLRDRRPDVVLTLKTQGIDGALRPEPATLLYRAARELVINALKHARPRSIRIAATKVDHRLHLVVEDDGTGVDACAAGRAHPSRGFGLRTLRDRLRWIGGRLEIGPRTAGGTRAALVVPVAPPGDASA